MRVNGINCLTPAVTQIKASEDLLTARSGGMIPKQRQFVGIKEGLASQSSVTRTLAEAFAREFAVLHKQMETIYGSAFVDLADGA